MTPKAELVNYFVDKILRGEMEFDQVRKELEAKKMDENDIRVIVRLVDDEVQAMQSGQSTFVRREFGKTPRKWWLLTLLDFLTMHMFWRDSHEQGFGGHNDRMLARKRETRFDRWRRR